jgi:hypothetical protein
LFSGLVLLSVALFWWGGRWVASAALLTVTSLVSVLLELAFRPNPFRWILPKGQSQNVWARVQPRQEALDNVVLIGHLDTHRTPLLFAKRCVRLLGNLVPSAMGACFLLMAAFVARIFLASPILSYAALPLAVVILALFLFMVQADFTPFAAGVTYLSDETFLLTTRCDPRYNAYAHAHKGAYTEGAIGGKHGFRVLSFVNCRRDGVLPEWHRPTDTIANIEPSVVENTFPFVEGLLRRIDADVPEKAGWSRLAAPR